jgi:hypothetical protein
MKRVIFLSMVIVLIIGGCTQQEVKSPLGGVWQVVSWERMRGDTLVATLGKEFTGSEMKIWSGNHFAFVGQYKSDTIVINNYGGGTFKLEGNRYEEYFLFPNQSTVKLLLEIKNDTVIQTWPIDENGQIIKTTGLNNVQKLVRME